MYLSFGTSGKRRSHHGREWGGHSMGHLPPQVEDGEQGTLDVPLFSDMLGEQPDLFSSLGPVKIKRIITLTIGTSHSLPHSH